MNGGDIHTRTIKNRPPKVVIAKPGLDGHDRGAKVVARALRDAGMEVVYTGIFQSPESIVTTVVHEDADVLGLSSLSGAHLEYAEDILALLHENGRHDVLFLVGGTIPGHDAKRLKQAGIAEVFGPGTPTGDIARFITEHFGGEPG
jgi:methylmalonyl-CoA mutase C-terminal domain/subunit